jgi:hypothetical protein
MIIVITYQQMRSGIIDSEAIRHTETRVATKGIRTTVPAK